MSITRHWLAHAPVPLLLIALAGASQAQSSPAADEAAAPLPAQRVVKDPLSGKLRAPEHDELAQQRESAAKTAAAPSALARGAAPQSNAERRAQTMQRFAGMMPLAATNGATGRRLDTSRLSFAVARRNADGSVNADCVAGESAAVAAMHGHPHADQEASHAK